MKEIKVGKFENVSCWNLVELRDAIDKILAEVPAEYRDGAVMEFSTRNWDDYDSPIDAEVYYERPHTPEELAEMEREKAKAIADKARIQEEMERRALAALKAKYE